MGSQSINLSSLSSKVQCVMPNHMKKNQRMVKDDFLAIYVLQSVIILV